MNNISLKRGETLNLVGSATHNANTDFTGWTITAQVRRKQDNRLAADNALTVVDAALGTFKILADTALWDIADYVLDIRTESPSGEVKISPTVVISIAKQITSA